MSGSSGSSQAPAAPTQQTVTNTNLPAYAQPAMETLIGQAQAATDINQNPYMPYAGQRVADFSGLQNQAFQNIGNMQPSQYTGQAADMTSAVGQQAQGLGSYQAGNFNSTYSPTQFSTGQFTNPGTAAAYMDPYMKNVVDYQSGEAIRDYQKTLPMEQQQAVARGAFGGNREALVQSEMQRNLNTQLGGIAATGASNAYQNAQNAYMTDQQRALQAQQMSDASKQFGSSQNLQAQQMGEQSRQFGAGLGMQGLSTQLAAAGQMGQLGQQQYQQGLGINQAQQQAGAAQQAQQQQGLNNQYQDYATQLNYPYKQIGFMSDILHGIPGAQSAQSFYQAPPSSAQTLASLGLGAYGISGLMKGMKKGGEVKMAPGGAVSDAYYQKAARGGSPTVDPVTASWIEKQRAMLRAAAAGAPEESGIGAAPAPNMSFADGGVVGYAAGDLVGDNEYSPSAVYPSPFMRLLDRFKGQQTPQYVAPSPAQLRTARNWDSTDGKGHNNKYYADLAAQMPDATYPPNINEETGQEYTPIGTPAAAPAAKPAPKTGKNGKTGIAAAAPVFPTGAEYADGITGGENLARSAAAQHADATNPAKAHDFDYWLNKLSGSEAEKGLSALVKKSADREAAAKAARGQDKYMVALQAAQALSQPGQPYLISALGNAAGVVGKEGTALRRGYESADEKAAENENKLGLAGISLQKDKETAALKAMGEERQAAFEQAKINLEQVKAESEDMYRRGLISASERDDRTKRAIAELNAATHLKVAGITARGMQRQTAADNATWQGLQKLALDTVNKDPQAALLTGPARDARVQEVLIKMAAQRGLTPPGLGGISAALPAAGGLTVSEDELNQG